MIKLIKAISLFCLLSINLLGVEYPKSYLTQNNVFLSDSNALYFNFHNTNFLWNNEFFNDVVEGYTLIGYHITPSFEYHFSENIKVEAGVHLLQYSGLDKFSEAVPIYRATYHKNDFAFVMGSLYGTINHKLPNPISNFENYLTNNIENGVQAIWNKDRFNLDIWLDWQNFIFIDDSTQEKLVSGISAETTFLKSNSWELSTPAYAMIMHRGGQIDTSQANMLTAMNYGLGLQVKKHFNYRFLNSVQAKFQFLGFTDNSPTVESIYKSGNGYLSELRLTYKESYLQFGHWYADRFLSLQGHPIYQTESVKGSEFNTLQRNLFTSKLNYSQNIYRGIYLGVIAETFYDLYEGNFDFTTGISLVIKQSFFLKRFKPNI